MATGRKTVVAGQVIDPVAWGNPLWDQSVQEFASDADRTAQFPVAQRRPGVVTWRDDNKTLEVWDGAAWQVVTWDTGWITTGLVWTPPAAPTALSGWRSAAYRRVGNYVRFNGAVAVSAGVAQFGTLVTVPPEVRPSSVYVGQGDFAFDIYSTGIIRVRVALPTAGSFGVDISWLLG